MRHCVYIGKSNTFNFCEGIELEMTRAGELVPESRGHRRRRRWRAFVRRITWWRRARTEVVAIDHEAGTITLATLRWSWRRWGWVRT